MKGVISNFRMGRHTQTCSHMIVHVDGSTTKEQAAALVNKSVVFKTPAGKEIKGKVAAAHGRNGAVRVIFETGMPGQALSKQVSVE
ncbi:50S ribosomal protein L35ae [Candidatus Woesearchaeota archaeon]|nr:50S ribosomal protein L35ae [Candidatus Woesearchaeota archaeon]